MTAASRPRKASPHGPVIISSTACLLAFVAWQSGDGALANIALDRALADNPRYSMALLLREALDVGAALHGAPADDTGRGRHRLRRRGERAEDEAVEDRTTDNAAVGDAPEASDRAGCGRGSASRGG